MKKQFIILISILIIALVFVAYFLFNGSGKETKVYSKHYSLSSISKEYNNQEYKNKFLSYQAQLEEAIKNYEQGGMIVEEKPNSDFFIEKARYAQYLGQTDWAIEILNNLFDYYDNSSVAWNNLAKLYEKKGDYNKANEYYQKIIDVFGEGQKWGFYYYIAKNCLIMDNKEKVEEYYEKYKSFGGFDSEIEEYLTEQTQ